MSTDPSIIRSLLREFRLDTFQTKHAVMQQFFKDSSSKPQSLTPMIRCIKKGIIAKHSAIIEFAQLALKNHWFKPSEHIIRAIHVTFLLDALTTAMCNSHSFFIEAQEHYRLQEKACGLDRQHKIRTIINGLKISHRIFHVIKAISVDPFMVYLRLQRGFAHSQLTTKEAKSLLQTGIINYPEYALLLPDHKNHLDHFLQLYRINICEAAVTDCKKNMQAGAMCAYALMEDMKYNPPQDVFKLKPVVPEHTTAKFYQAMTEKENLFPTVDCSQSWISLYITWNIAFILDDLDNLDILMPKLFIPSLISAEPENFSGVRAVSLWLSINHNLFREAENKKLVRLRNKTNMAKAWAAINKKYAFELLQTHTHQDYTAFMVHFNQFKAHPVLNLVQQLKNFLYEKV